MQEAAAMNTLLTALKDMPPPYVRSDTLTALLPAYAKAQEAFSIAIKDAVNPHLKNKYADLGSVMEACIVPLRKQGLVIFQPVQSADGQRVTVTTLLIHCASGEYLGSSLTLTPQQATPQGIGSAITYARRYTLSSLVGVLADDDDGHAASAPQRAAPALRPATLGPAAAAAVATPSPTPAAPPTEAVAPKAEKPKELTLDQRAKVAHAKLVTLLGKDKAAQRMGELKAKHGASPASDNKVPETHRAAFVTELEAEAAG